MVAWRAEEDRACDGVSGKGAAAPADRLAVIERIVRVVDVEMSAVTISGGVSARLIVSGHPTSVRHSGLAHARRLGRVDPDEARRAPASPAGVQLAAAV